MASDDVPCKLFRFLDSAWSCCEADLPSLPAVSCVKGFWLGCDDDEEEEEESSRFGRDGGAGVTDFEVIVVVDDSVAASSCAPFLGGAFPSFASRLLRIYKSQSARTQKD